MKGQIYFSVGSIRGHQKIKRNCRRMLLDAPGHRRLTPYEKKYKALKKPYRSPSDV